LYSFRRLAPSLQYTFRGEKTEFLFKKLSSTPLDRDISILNMHIYRSYNFMRYSNVSACDAAQRGALEWGSTDNNKAASM
jgi:hypothetical protein